MSYDRGTFGELLEKLVKTGATSVDFGCDLLAPAEDAMRWQATAWQNDGVIAFGHGRTGEEALRDCVDAVGVLLAISAEQAS